MSKATELETTTLGTCLPEVCHISASDGDQRGNVTPTLCGVVSPLLITCEWNCPCPNVCVVCDALDGEGDE